MTEEELHRLQSEKQRVTAELRAKNIKPYRLGTIDQRLKTYIGHVITHPDKHNLYEQLAVEKFFGKMDRYGFAVRPYKTFVRFYESLYFPGKSGHQRYELTGVQCFQYANIFGFWEGDRRVVREVCLYVPRKFSKTTSTASLALYDLLFGDGNAEIYVAANSQDQSRKCFDVIRGSMFRLDPEGTFYTINQDVVKSRRSDRSSFAQCLTAGARTKDGLNASTVIMDEFSQARDNALLTVLTTSMGVRDNPLTVIITTASDVFDGPFYAMLQGYKAVLLGDYEDDSVFAHLFEPDIDDAEDDPQTWRKVHPHLGVTVNADFYEQEYRKAQRQGAEAMLAFRTKLLNVYAESDQRSWITASEIRVAMKKYDPNKLGERLLAVVSIDLSESRDFTAVTISHYQPKGNVIYMHTAYFYPEGALPKNPNERLYRAWASAGHLHLLPGEVIDYDAIVNYIIGLTEHSNIQGIGYDQWHSRQMINDLQSHPDARGAETVLRAVPQSYGYFTAPVEAFEHGLKTGKIIIDDNPITAYCFGNAVLDFDKNENCKPQKRQSNGNLHIDGVITILMCMRQWIDLLQSPTAES